MKICPVTLPCGTSRKAYLHNCGLSVHLKSRGASEQSKESKEDFPHFKADKPKVIRKMQFGSCAFKPLVQMCLLSFGGFGSAGLCSSNQLSRNWPFPLFACSFHFALRDILRRLEREMLRGKRSKMLRRDAAPHFNVEEKRLYFPLQLWLQLAGSRPSS